MKKKILFILLCIACLFTTVGCVKKIENPKEDTGPKYASVNKGMKNLNEEKNYRMEMELKTIVDDGDKVQNTFALKIENDDDVKKVQITVDSVSYSFYIEEKVDRQGNTETYVYINPSVFEINYDGYVKTTFKEISELFGIADFIEEEQNLVTDALKSLVEFFSNPDDSYFDTKDYFKHELNKKGKEAFEEAIDAFIKAISEGEESANSVDIKVDAQLETNDKYVTEIKLDLTGKNVDTNDEEIIRTTVYFDHFGEINLNLPKDTITLQEFVEMMQNSTIYY